MDDGVNPIQFAEDYQDITWTDYEHALNKLERGAATVTFSSGMAAVTGLLGAVLNPGDTLLVSPHAYYPSRLLATGFFKKIGVQVHFLTNPTAERLADCSAARLLWLESPSNPGLEVFDIAQLTAAARPNRLLVAVDNTTATCFGQQPLALGADFSLSSDTKTITGRGDLILGHVSVRDARWAEKLRHWRSRMNSAPGLMEIWLAYRSLATLAYRLERQSNNAMAVAGFLTARYDICNVRYPGLPGDPAFATASRQMKRYGPIVSFALADHCRADQCLKHCQIIFPGPSFGGTRSTAEWRARWPGDPMADGFIRLNTGCEDAAALIADLRQALDGI
jgi:cystathionine gamma-lyase